MDYEKKYKNALERFKAFKETYCTYGDLHLGDVLFDKTGKAQEELDNIFPELTESEDEKMIKAILSAIRGGLDTEKFLEKHGTNYEEVEAYLEKQKERKEKEIPKWMPKFLDELRSKKHYFDWDEHRDIEGSILAIINFIAPNYFKQKEQNPAEKQDYSGLTDFERAIHRGFLCAGVENVPVEIIKETAQDCLAHIEQKERSDTRTADDLQLLGFIYDLLATLDWRENYAMSKEECLRRLGEYRPQKPAEWSEEEFEIFRKTLAKDAFLDEITSKRVAKKLLNSVKSLRLQPKHGWSAEDDNRLRNLFNIIDDARGWNDVSKESFKGWLKSLRPRSSWKPSEEQMEALNTLLCTGDFSYVGQATKLQELYTELKKLKPQGAEGHDRDDTLIHGS